MGFDKYGSGESFESCDKFGSGGYLYLPEADKSVVPGSLEEEVKKIQDAFIQAFQPLLDKCFQIIQDIRDELSPLIQQATKEIVRLYDLVLESYPDKRIVWLALHHKKERVRKKNRKRILKWIERMAKQNGRCKVDQDNNGHL